MDLHPAVETWLAAAFPEPTPAQRLAIPVVARGGSLLLASPTGSGKTLAAFLGILSRLHHLADDDRLPEGIACVYVSPLKALANDVAKNLLAPRDGVAEIRPDAPPIRVALRTGETPRAERERMAREPPHVLVTTPESLALLLASPRVRPHLAHVRHVVVDEVHALVGTKRGDHLALSLERLDHLVTTSGAPRPARVGLSATARPLPLAADWLTGGRGCRIEEVAHEGPLRVEVGLAHPDPLRASDDELQDAVLDRIEAVLAHARTALVFANTRAAAETLAKGLRARLGDDVEDDAGEPGVMPHHGSMSRETRLRVEDRLRAGHLRCVVSSSSLELGVHVDHADAVILLGSPKSSARVVQRVGRSGHRVGGEPSGLLLVHEPDELPEAVALAALASRREIEPLDDRPGGLDILAQHLVGCALDGVRDADEAYRILRGAWPYRGLARTDLDAVLGSLRAESRLLDDRAFAPRNGRARWAYLTQAGAIPRSGLVRVLHGARYVGEVEEAFAETLGPHDVFQLAGDAWRFERALGATLLVRPARGANVTMPTWRSEGLAASPLLARALDDLLRERASLRHVEYDSTVTKETLSRFVEGHRAALAERDDELVLETCLADDGRRALILHARLGRRANDALARALAARLAERDEDARPLATDLGCGLLLRRGWRPTERALARLFAAPFTLPRPALGETMRRRFRHVAERAFLLDDEQAATGRQRQADRLLARLLARDPEHPFVREARREALEDAMDLPRAEALRADVARGALRLRLVDGGRAPSPVAASILLPRGATSRRDRRDRLGEYLDAHGASARPAPLRPRRI